MANKLKERSRTLIIDLFANYTVTIVTSDNIHQSAEKRGIIATASWEAMHCGASSGLFSYIFLPDKARADIIAHESFHCVWHIMKMIGAEHENEVMAYTLSYLVGEITAFIQNEKRPRRPKTPARGPLSKTLCHTDTVRVENNRCN